MVHFFRPKFAIDIAGEFDEKIEQRPIAGLAEYGESPVCQRIPRMRLPRGRDHASGKGPAVKRPLRAQFAFGFVVGEKISHDGVPCPWPESAAPALIVTRFILKLRIPQRRQTIRRNELALARCEALAVSSPSPAPLRGRPARLVNSCGEHPLEIIARSQESLLQINVSSLRRSHRHHFPLASHIRSGGPANLPIPRPDECCLSQLLRRFRRLHGDFLGRFRRRLRRIRVVLVGVFGRWIFLRRLSLLRLRLWLLLLLWRRVGLVLIRWNSFGLILTGLVLGR